MSAVKRSKLAIFGGKKAVPDGLIKPWPEVREEDKQAVMAVLERGEFWGVSAPEITALQDEWAGWLGVNHCLATNSGTAALHMAVAAVGVGPGDEVITTPFSWTSTATCILHHNAIPVFADIEPLSCNIDPAKIEARITARTKAIMPVHLYGLPANMDPILELAAKHNLAVIEDCCQAHGAEYKGQQVGTFGDVAAFSLNGSKNLSGGEGGLFVTNDEHLWQEAARVQQFGEARRTDGVREYNAYGMGWMYRTSEMPAAFAHSQLRRLDEITASIRENCHYMTTHLGDMPGFRTPYEPNDHKHTFFRYVIQFTPERLGLEMPVKTYAEKVKAALKAEGVSLGRAEFVIPAMTLFQEMEGYGKGCPWTCGHCAGNIAYQAEDYPVAMDAIERVVALIGMKPPNGKELLDRYLEAIHKVYDSLDEVLEIDVAAGN